MSDIPPVKPTPAEERDATQIELRGPERPLQFGILQLLQLMTLVSLWCAIGAVGGSVAKGVGFLTFATPLTWWLVGRWAGGFSEVGFRRVMALLATIMTGAALGVLVLTVQGEHIPFFAIISWGLVQIPWRYSPAVGMLGNALLCLLVYLIWLGAMKAWDASARFAHSASENLQPIASTTAIVIGLLNAPLFIVMLTGCYTLSGHEGALTFHEPIHCVTTIGTMALGLVVFIAVARFCGSTFQPAPNWIRLLVWGYCCGYVQLAQIALFPVHLYVH